MTVSEFREEFKLLYDNISSNAAPGLDDYEVSVYLTTAQLELVKKAYSGGEKKEGFEGNERRRRELSSLVETGMISVFAPASNNELENTVSCSLPNDILYILSERVKITSTDSCINNTFIEVVPVSLDELSLVEENPFRRASKRKALRIDSSWTPNSIDLLCTETIASYHIRYLSVPSPIILSDLTTIAAGLTINGLTTPQTCLLNEGMHREILNRAVALAIRDYRENSLQNKIQSELGLDYKED